MTRIIIRGAAEIEIILPAGVEPPTVRAAEQAPVSNDTAGSSAANPSGCDGALATDGPTSQCEDGASPAGPHDALPTVLDEPTVAALMAKVGDQVREAVANPPPPVEPPDELALRRPAGDALDLPAFLDRRPVRSHG